MNIHYNYQLFNNNSTITQISFASNISTYFFTITHRFVKKTQLFHIRLHIKVLISPMNIVGSFLVLVSSINPSLLSFYHYRKNCLCDMPKMVQTNYRTPGNMKRILVHRKIKKLAMPKIQGHLSGSVLFIYSIIYALIHITQKTIHFINIYQDICISTPRDLYHGINTMNTNTQKDAIPHTVAHIRRNVIFFLFRVSNRDSIEREVYQHCLELYSK